MAKEHSVKLSAVEELLDQKWLEEAARETGAVKRQGKIKIAALVWTLILGFGASRERSIAGLRRAFINATGVAIRESSFYDRFTGGLVKLLKLALTRCVGALAEPTHSLTGVLESFKDLVVTDATVIRLRDLLAPAYAACRTNHTKAAAKLHVVLSVLGRGPHTVKLTSERTKDKNVLQVGPWVKGRLLLFDLAYYCFHLFDRIDRNDGYFISRAKRNANPKITGINLTWRGRSIDVVGKSLKEVLPQLKRSILDVEVEVRFKKRKYKGTQRTITRRLRLVGIYNVEEQHYHLYYTNVPAERLSAEQIAQVYRARWEVELLFKELKGFYGLDEIPSGKREVAEALILAAVLAAVVSRTLLTVMRRRLSALRRRLPTRRFAAIFSTVARQVLIAILASGRYARECWERIEMTLLAEVVDPNVSRRLNLEAVGVPL